MQHIMRQNSHINVNGINWWEEAKLVVNQSKETKLCFLYCTNVHCSHMTTIHLIHHFGCVTVTQTALVTQS